MYQRHEKTVFISAETMLQFAEYGKLFLNSIFEIACDGYFQMLTKTSV